MKKVLLSSVILLSVAASANVALAADGGTYGSKGAIVFKPSEGQTDPQDPNKPGEPVEPGENPEFPGETPEPGTKGPLSIDFASSFGFGTQDITTSDKVYNSTIQRYVKKIKDAEGNWIPDPANKITEGPSYVQVTDNRGTEAGWTLKVKQADQFTSEKGGHKLDGAKISFTNGVVVTDSASAKPSNVPSFTLDFDNEAEGSAESIVMAAAKGTGAGTYLNNFGTWKNDGKPETPENPEENTRGYKGNSPESVQLSVPGKTTKYAERYVTNLVWTLSDTVPTK